MQGNRDQLMFGEVMMRNWWLCWNKLIAGYRGGKKKDHRKNLFGKCYGKK